MCVCVCVVFWKKIFFFVGIVDVNIEAAGSAYPRRIQIQKGDTIRFHNKITQNRVEHTITPDKAGNSHLWFGGLSFYASNLGGLYVSYLQIDGIGQGPFFTQVISTLKSFALMASFLFFFFFWFLSLVEIIFLTTGLCVTSHINFM